MCRLVASLISHKSTMNCIVDTQPGHSCRQKRAQKSVAMVHNHPWFIITQQVQRSCGERATALDESTLGLPS